MKEQEYATRGFFGRIPYAPHDMTDRITPTEGCIVLCHLGVPRCVAGDEWTLEIAGNVARPSRFSVGELKTLPKTELIAVHQCAGSPMAPHTPTQRVCNVRWGGVRLDHLLDLVKVETSAAFVWSYGADSGEFGGIDCGHYLKDLPISRSGEDVLLAYEMNGSELLPEHGHPLRLVVPGYYGTNSVKWLRRIELRSERAPGPFTTRWYNDTKPDGLTRPVWEIAPQSVIVSPKPGGQVRIGDVVRVWGWAWADGGVAAVEVSFDLGRTWIECTTESASGRSWTRFVCDWRPSGSETNLLSRAISLGGEVQPSVGQRNAFYAVPISTV